MCENKKNLPAGSVAVKADGEDMVGPWLQRNLLVAIVTALVRLLGRRLFGRGSQMAASGGAESALDASSKLPRT